MATNNRGELTALLALLRATADAGRADEPLSVLADSQYVINSVTKWLPNWKRRGWRKADGKPVLNVDLMMALDDAMRGRQIKFTWVRGHAGHRLNEAADERAHNAALAYQAGGTAAPGPGFDGQTGARPFVSATEAKAVASPTLW